MRLQPHQAVFLGVALFMAGLLLALMLAHGQPQPPTPFETPF
jgi:hypothetical protein